MVLDTVVIFFSSTIGLFIMVIAVVGLSFSGWKARKLMHADPQAFEALKRTRTQFEGSNCYSHNRAACCFHHQQSRILWFSFFQPNPKYYARNTDNSVACLLLSPKTQSTETERSKVTKSKMVSCLRLRNTSIWILLAKGLLASKKA